jgi:N-acetylmuramic acid 6-phosphate etherase
VSQDLRETEHSNPATVDLDLANALRIVDLISAQDRTVADAVAKRRAEIAQMIDTVEYALRNGRRLIYLGAGTSGRLGVLDASEIPPTFGEEPGRVVGVIAGGDRALREAVEGAEDRPDEGRGDLVRVQLEGGDVVIGIAASGNTPYVRAGLQFARSIGARTALVCCATPGEPMRKAAEVIIHIETGPEVITGSTRMKAGTATKMVLNMITTGAMVRCGKTYRNLMVDLTATNVKLVDRSERIFMEVCKTDRETARAMIDQAGGSVKLAIVMHARGVEEAEAREMLEHKLGFVRGVVGPYPEPFPT